MVALLRRVLIGLLAGAIGTLVMDALLYRRYRKTGGKSGFKNWEFAAGVKDFGDDAPTPARVGQRLVKLVLARDIPDDKAGLTTNVVHWATGTQWGAAYGAAAGAAGANIALGVPLGLIACGTSYAVLPLAKLYKPIWKYDAPTLAKDFSAHVVFGVVSASAYRALSIATRSQ